MKADWVGGGGGGGLASRKNGCLIQCTPIFIFPFAIFEPEADLLPSLVPCYLYSLTAASIFSLGIVLCRNSDRHWLCHVVLLHARFTQKYDLCANDHNGLRKLYNVSDVTGYGSRNYW